MHALDPAWEAVKRELDAACSQAAQVAQAQLTGDLNHAARRFRQYRSEQDWVAAVVSAVERFAGQSALFSLQGDTLRLRGGSQLDLPQDFSFPMASSPAFANAVRSQDSIVALRTPGQVGDLLSSAEAAERAHIVPIMNGERVTAVLFATGRVDLNGVELVAAMASLVLERQANAALNVQIDGPGPIAPARPQRSQTLPPWTALNDEQRSLHLRAQRFSRVKVAEMQLSRPEACRAGLEQNDVYLFLKKEIDSAREAYRAQFMTTPSMLDYLHVELVRTAAEGQESKLGADYPGQLV